MPGPWRPTRDERLILTELVRRMIGLRAYLSQIKEAFRARVLEMAAARGLRLPEGYRVDTETINMYVARAREEIRAMLKLNRDDQIGESLTFYNSQIRDPAVPPAVKVKAQQAIDDLLGLHVPKQVHVYGDFDAMMEKHRMAISSTRGTVPIEPLARQTSDAAAVAEFMDGIGKEKLGGNGDHG